MTQIKWRDASKELPKDELEQCLVRYKYPDEDDGVIRYGITISYYNKSCSKHHNGQAWSFLWGILSDEYKDEVTEWCYLNELLPEEIKNGK